MRRSSVVSVRRVLVGAAFCALGGAAGCGRETFDLLVNDGVAGASLGDAGSSSGDAGSSQSGAGSSAGGAGYGAGGRALNTSGTGGRLGFPSAGGGAGGSAGGFPTGCSESDPLCITCSSDKDCNSEAPLCDTNLGRCYQCRPNGKDDCPTGKACNNFTLRCSKPCKDFDDCTSEPTQRLCHNSLGVCVSCLVPSDCDFYNSSNSEQRCSQYLCVQCTNDRQCPSLHCVAGHCQNPH